MTTKEKRQLVEKDNSQISVSRQAELLGISRSGIYYQPKANAEERGLMNLIDKIYTDAPFYGSRKIRDGLKKYHQIRIGRHRVRRLMRVMGIEAIYPKSKRNFSQADSRHKKYPYLLKGLKIDYPNQVWSADITYIRLEEGFAYLTAIMDWFSRYVLSWRLSNNLEADFCIEALEEALNQADTEIFNSDQGSQFTAPEFTGRLLSKKIKISMDGRGRYLDNIFTERLWRTVKYENIYLKSYCTMPEAKAGLTDYFRFYNQRRLHQSLNYQTPAEIYFSH